MLQGRENADVTNVMEPTSWGDLPELDPELHPQLHPDLHYSAAVCSRGPAAVRIPNYVIWRNRCPWPSL